MVVERKTISRNGWQRILESCSSYTHVQFQNLDAVIGLLYLKRTANPLYTAVFDQHLKIVDDGYYWMQLAPKGQNWWLSVMINSEKQIIQYYFDITKENVICEEDSYFWDLFLDVVVLPDGRMALLDQDELDAALEEKIITKEEYALAEHTARKLMEQIPGKRKRLEEFCYDIFEELLLKITI